MTRNALFPCSATDAKRIRAKWSGLGPHPLEGKSVAQWVAEARAGWPGVPPVPKRRPQFPCSPTDARRIRRNSFLTSPHPLEGKSVAQWVAEARAGWPGVPPVPRDPERAGREVSARWPDEPGFRFDWQD